MTVSYEVVNGNITKHEWMNPSVFDECLGRSDAQALARKEFLDVYIKKGLRIPLFLKNKIVRKLSAERDIKRENYSGLIEGRELFLNYNGEQATEIICTYVNDLRLDRDVVQKELLEALNQIFWPDNHFNEITVRHHGKEGYWEIFLAEEKKGLIPLSLSGSGLKTVILVLLNLLVVPRFKNTTLAVDGYIYVFEELENNIHPTLLRRLFRYIEEFAIQKGCNFFITTHSNVVIDIFSSSSSAQIVHVVHDGRQACATTVKTFEQKNSILEDIGAKASDLLQANGIVWLEGPSDRIYFNKWIEIFSEGKLREHRDYECAFYGGALLAHFDAVAPEEQGEAVNILKINRNAILIGDSDKTDPAAELKPRLKNMKEAMEKIRAYIWVTEVKEIENYIPATVLQKIFNKTKLSEIGQYEKFYDSNEKKKSADERGYWQDNAFEGKYDKVELAHNVVQYLEKEMLENRYDLQSQMIQICDIIKKWNENRISIE